jgi:CRP-like cAMP-binding protein
MTLNKTMKQNLEYLIFGAIGLLGLAWALTTRHLPMDWFKLDYLIDLSSLLTVASFSVRGMLPLRALAASSQIIAIPYFAAQTTPLWTPAAWTVLFLAINLYHITRILLEKRPVRFTPDEQRLYDLAFHTFESGNFLKLAKLGEWKTARAGQKILSRGDSITHVSVPISGRVAIRQGEKELGELVPGELVGAGIALTGQPSPMDAEIAEDVHYMCWSVTEIYKFLEENPELALKFNDIVNRHLVSQIDKLALNFIESRER